MGLHRPYTDPVILLQFAAGSSLVRTDIFVAGRTERGDALFQRNPVLLVDPELGGKAATSTAPDSLRRDP